MQYATLLHLQLAKRRLDDDLTLPDCEARRLGYDICAGVIDPVRDDGKAPDLFQQLWGDRVVQIDDRGLGKERHEGCNMKGSEHYRATF